MIAFLMAIAMAAPAQGDLKTFKDWIVGCDNGLACQADGVLPEDDSVSATIAVKRGAEADAVPEIWFRVDDGNPADMVADGRPLHLHLTAREDGAEVAAADTPRLANALVSAKSLSIVDSAGKEIAAISLAGSTAALLYMDDKQRRVGTVTALVRKGSSSASSIPAPPSLPVIASAAPSILAPVKLSAAEVGKIRGEDVCEDPTREEEVEYHRLDDHSTLALIPEMCASGAYNFFYVPMIVGNDGKARAAMFDDMKQEVSVDENGVFNTSWDPKARTLETGMKGRGIGDCGAWSTYAWDGARFRLIELNVMNDCRGSIDFITVWRAKAVERR